MQKLCSHCQTKKDLSEFGKNAALPDGLSFYCLACNRAKAAAHYRKRRRADLKDVREPDLSPVGFKRCAACMEAKPVGDFHKTARTNDGLVIYCKPCRKDLQRRMRLLRVYGLTEEMLQEMIQAQGGLCAICKARPAVHVDHDHTFDHVRGVLCFACNVSLGNVKDDIQLLHNMIDYLERTTWQRTLVSAGVYQLTSPRTEAASPPSSELHSLISSRRS